MEIICSQPPQLQVLPTGQTGAALLPPFATSPSFLALPKEEKKICSLMIFLHSTSAGLLSLQ